MQDMDGQSEFTEEFRHFENDAANHEDIENTNTFLAYPAWDTVHADVMYTPGMGLGSLHYHNQQDMSGQRYKRVSHSGADSFS